MNALTLPVNIDSFVDKLDSNSITELESLNARYSDFKKQLKDLNRDKGILSRRIGEAKKSNSKDEEAIAEIKKVSASIKAINASVSELKAEIEALVSKPKAEPEPSLPGHFSPFVYAKNESPAFEVVSFSDEGAEKWNSFVDKHPNSCIYHRYEFRKIIETSFGHNCVYLAAVGSGGDILGVLPSVQINSRIFGNYFVSIPMFNYAGPLAESEAIEIALVDKACEKAVELEASHVELRDTRPRDNYVQKTSKYSLTLPLPREIEQLWGDLGSKVRAQIKRSEPFNLVFKAGGEELLDDFYKVFSINMRDLGTPVYSKSFFRNILRCDSLSQWLTVVYYNNEPVSCGFLLGYKETMEIPWASTLRSANKLNANMFMYWHILKFSIEHKYKFFDFGRSTKDAGTYNFKKQWGAKPIPLYWHYWLKDGGDLPELNPNNPKYRMAISVWQKLPVWLTHIIGPPLVKNLP